jgi:SPP1 family predicted phage head-tail adaptor
MRAGRLRHRVNLQSYTETQDSTGHPSKSGSTFATVWADIQPLRGSEDREAQRLTGSQQFKITIRYNSAIDIKSKVVEGSDTYEINSISDYREIHRFMELTCTRSV